MRYFYANKDNQPTGPVSREDLDALVAKGELKPSVFILEEGGKEWKTYSTLPKNSVVPLPPPPAASAPSPSKPATARIAASQPIATPVAPAATISTCPYCNAVTASPNRCTSCGAALTNIARGVAHESFFGKIVRIMKVELKSPKFDSTSEAAQTASACPKCNNAGIMKMESVAASPEKVSLLEKFPQPQRLNVGSSFKLVPKQNWIALACLVVSFPIYQALLKAITGSMPNYMSNGISDLLYLPLQFSGIAIVGYLAYIVWATMDQYNNKVFPVVYQRWASKNVCEKCSHFF